jgi:hypothetical protein
MNQEQEIRAKALEIAVQALALLPEVERLSYMRQKDHVPDLDLDEAVKVLAEEFERYLKDADKKS